MKITKGLWIVLGIAILSIGAAQATDMVLPDLSVIKVAEGGIYDRSLIWNNVDNAPNQLPPVIAPVDAENQALPIPMISGMRDASMGQNKPVPGLIVSGDSTVGLLGPRSIRVSSPRLNADREIRYLIRTLN